MCPKRYKHVLIQYKNKKINFTGRPRDDFTEEETFESNTKIGRIWLGKGLLYS